MSKKRKGVPTNTRIKGFRGRVAGKKVGTGVSPLNRASQVQGRGRGRGRGQMVNRGANRRKQAVLNYKAAQQNLAQAQRELNRVNKQEQQKAQRQQSYNQNRPIQARSQSRGFSSRGGAWGRGRSQRGYYQQNQSQVVRNKQQMQTIRGGMAQRVKAKALNVARGQGIKSRGLMRSDVILQQRTKKSYGNSSVLTVSLPNAKSNDVKIEFPRGRGRGRGAPKIRRPPPTTVPQAAPKPSLRQQIEMLQPAVSKTYNYKRNDFSKSKTNMSLNERFATFGSTQFTVQAVRGQRGRGRGRGRGQRGGHRGGQRGNMRQTQGNRQREVFF